MRPFNVAFALWYIKNKKLIDLVLLLFLLTVNIVIGVYVLVLGWQYLSSPSPRGGALEVNLPSQAEKEDLVVLSQKIVSSDHLYGLVGQINNPNQEFGLQDFSYKFILLDAQGNTIQEVGGSTYILPQETRYIIRSGVDLGEEKVQGVRLEVVPGDWVRKKHIVLPEFTLELGELSLNSVGQMELFGVIENKGDYSYKTVEVNVLLQDKQGAVVGVNYTTLNNFYTKTRREFRVQWPLDLRSEVEKTLVELETNIYDVKNFIELPAEENGGEPSEYRDI